MKLTAEVEHVKMRGTDMGVAAGTYSITVKDTTVNGNFCKRSNAWGGV